MSIIFITKCLFIYFPLICEKNLVDSTDSSATHNPGTGTQGGTAVTTKQAGGSDTGTKTGVELSIKATAATDQFEYTKEGQVATYTAKGSNAFKSVKTGDKVVWTAEDNKYADKVILYGKGKRSKSVTIYIPNGSNMAYVRNGKDKPWQSFDLSKTNKVCLNVLCGSDNLAYTYKKENKIETFTANPGFVFNEVISKYGSQKSEVWKTTSENEYANLVEVESNKLTIHLKDNITKVYKSSGASWVEDTEASNQGSGTGASDKGAKPTT